LKLVLLCAYRSELCLQQFSDGAAGFNSAGAQIEYCIREGFRPTIAQEVTTFAEAMAMVSDGVGFAFTRECYSHVRWPGVVIKNVEGQPLAIESALVFRKEIRSTVVPAIITALQIKKKPASVLASRRKAADD
jgi:DNA-binding transcriptional LysR family regulator